MKFRTLIEYVGHPRRLLLRYVLGILVVLDLLDTLPIIVDKDHAHTAVEVLPGFWTLFGFLGCVAIILLSKWFGHAGVMTREDYYDE